MQDEQPLLTYTQRTLDHRQTLTLYADRVRIEGRLFCKTGYESTITLDTFTGNYQRMKVRTPVFKPMAWLFVVSIVVAVIDHYLSAAPDKSAIGWLLSCLPVVFLVGVAITFKRRTCVLFLSRNGTPLAAVFKAGPEGDRFEGVVADMLRAIEQVRAVRTETPVPERQPSEPSTGDQPILSHADRTILRRQTLTLYHDRIHVAGKAPLDRIYDLSYPLTTLDPVPAHVYVRESIFWTFLGFTIISVMALYLYYDMTPAGHPVQAIELLIPMPFIMLSLAAMTFKRKHAVVFHNIHGGAAFDLYRRRQTKDEFQQLIDRISTQIRNARAPEETKRQGV